MLIVVHQRCILPDCIWNIIVTPISI
jgi:hypothetical protein